ncbi:MAG TPA: glucosamine-6-phosphate deaminase [Bacilli bacterium]
MNIMKFHSEADLNQAGAGMFASLLQAKPAAVLGLATGSTPLGIYAELVKLYRKGMISFDKATTFNLDEYIGLSANHPQSYRSYMNEHLFRHINLPKDRMHIPDGNAANPEAECARYEKLLQAAGQIDLQLLGLGHNGHIGFNEPSDTLASETHIVKLAENTRAANARFFSSPAEVPTHAITMGVGSILRAKTIMLIARGQDKAEIVRRALTGPVTTQCPASLLQTHANVVVLLDKAAGQYI